MASGDPSTPFVMGYELIWDDPQVHVLRVPIVQLGLRYTNCYVVRDADDVLIIDPGTSSPLIGRAFAHIADELGFVLPQARFFCTHLHFDHAALLKQLTQPGTRILVGKAAYNNNAWSYYELRNALLKSVMIEEGVPAMSRRGLAATKWEPRVCDLPDREYELLTDGQTVTVGAHELRVIETPGHASGHLCLYDAEQRILFSGDHVLEKITSGLAFPFEGDDCLHDYLISLGKVEGLKCSQVLPGHGTMFHGLAERCNSLRQHHAHRLSQVYEVVARNPGCNGYLVMREIPWKQSGPYENLDELTFSQKSNMAAQTFAYLEFLMNSGEIVREEDFAGRHYRIA